MPFFLSKALRSVVVSLLLGVLPAATVLAKEDVQITILQTTDLHHHANGADHVGLDVDPQTGTGAVGAYSRIAAYVGYVRSSVRHPVLLVDSGDWTMGTLYDLTLGSQPLALRFMKLMRYDAVTLGNHEFDYGPGGLARILANAQAGFGFRTPIVATNIDLNGNPDLAPYVGPGKAIQPWRIQRIDNGLRVAYIGLMGANAALDAAASAPVRFAAPSAQYAALQALVDDLRKQHAADIVIALSHSGTDRTGSSGEDVELARHVKGIDVIASGHTHTPLASATRIANGAWSTTIVDAGAFGTNVFRLDLNYDRRTKALTVLGSTNVPMTDASLAGVQAGLQRDPRVSWLVLGTDHELNAALGGFFAQQYPGYAPARLATGIYRAVGSTATDLVSNASDPLPAPNGLGDLSADAVRAVTNQLIAQALAAVGGNPALLPGFDTTPVQVTVVASGTLRGALRSGVPLSFADVYGVLPLGASPDTSQALPVGFPLISSYLETDDLKKLCALQLVVQTGLTSGDNYLNFSGLSYALKAAESAEYFRAATAAAVLQVTSGKATAGSAAAGQALGALATLASDHGAALLTLAAAGNPYAAAMVQLNDATQVATNLGALGQVAAAAAAGGNVLSSLVVAKAVAAIDTVSGFGIGDAANLGATVPLVAGARSRVVADLYAVLALGAIQAQFGIAITPYQSATGAATLSAADFPGLLANRVDAAPATPGVQELKEWMALLLYLQGGLGGTVSPLYSSTSNFAQFPAFGAAVANRNSSYPLPALGQLASMLGGLQAAP